MISTKETVFVHQLKAAVATIDTISECL